MAGHKHSPRAVRHRLAGVTGRGCAKKPLESPAASRRHEQGRHSSVEHLGTAANGRKRKDRSLNPFTHIGKDFLRQREQSLEVTTSLGQNSWFLGELKQAESSTKTLKSPALTANQIYLVTSASFELLFLTESRICQKPWMLWLYTGD